MNESRNVFTVIGVATNPEGEVRVRFTNDIVTKTKILVKKGDTDIQLFELPEPMSKIDALRWLNDKNLPGDAGFVVSFKLAEKIRAEKKAAGKVNKAMRSLDELKAEAQKVEPVEMHNS